MDGFRLGKIDKKPMENLSNLFPFEMRGEQMQIEIAYTVLVWIILVIVSQWFNRVIDGTPVDDRPDGLTAYWVLIGCGYALMAGTVLTVIWRTHLPAAAFAFGLTVFAIFSSAFAAAGIPMAIGDIRRTHSFRRREATLQVLADAEDYLDGKRAGYDTTGRVGEAEA